MMSRGTLLFGDGHLDGRTLWTGDKAEKLTSGVARKERNFLCGLEPQTWNLLQQKHPKCLIPTPPDITLPSGAPALPPEFNIMSALHSFPRNTACGPSGLHIQHLMDAAEVHLAISISSSLRALVNILASGKAPIPISRYLAGGSLTALIKDKEGLSLDIHPIAVGEAIRRLTEKCLCTKDAIRHAISLIQKLGLPLGLWINPAKCKLFSPTVLSGFPQEMKLSHEPNFKVLGAPIGDPIFCAKFLAQKRAKAAKLLSQLATVGSLDPQVALLLLHKCAVIPLVGLYLHLEPDEFQIVLKWWLGINASLGSYCPYCPDHQLDPLGHHAVMCKVLPSSVSGGQLEVDCGLGADKIHSRPADTLVQNWIIGKPAAADLMVTSPLNSTNLIEAGATIGSAAMSAEVWKHLVNNPKCSELGWGSIPLAVETYGCWGAEAQCTFVTSIPSGHSDAVQQIQGHHYSLPTF
ncbi:hypothetical protein EMCRGX_G033776 [Ephydatia muelleri]